MQEARDNLKSQEKKDLPQYPGHTGGGRGDIWAHEHLPHKCEQSQCLETIMPGKIIVWLDCLGMVCGTEARVSRVKGKIFLYCPLVEKTVSHLPAPLGHASSLLLGAASQEMPELQTSAHWGPLPLC